MSSPSLSTLSAETARLDRQTGSRSGRDEGALEGASNGAGSFSGMLDQARLTKVAQTSTPPATPPATPSAAPASEQAQAQTQPQRPVNTRPLHARQVDHRQLDQRQAQTRQAPTGRSEEAKPAEVDEASATPTVHDDDRTDPSAASGATPTWLMHTVVRATLGGAAAAAGPGANGAAASVQGGPAPSNARLGGRAGVEGLDGVAAKPESAGLANVAGQTGAVELASSFQAAPGSETFAALVATQATQDLPATQTLMATPGLASGLTSGLAPALASALASAPDAGTPGARVTEALIDTPVDAPGFGAAVMHKVVHLARDGAQEIKLHLNPIEMGPIQIRIAIESGQARIEFGAAAEATRQALEQAMPALAQSLQADGLSLADGSGVARSADPTLANQAGQQPGGASAQAGGGQPQGQGPGERADAPRRPSGSNGSSDAAGRNEVRAPVGHELRTGWVGTSGTSDGALRALDLYA